jgi:hypothetical protein
MLVQLGRARFPSRFGSALQRSLTTATRDAFLEPVHAHPGVSCLNLNRPTTKNAISVRLLQVSTGLSSVTVGQYKHPVFQSNFRNVWSMRIMTKGL